MNHYILNISTQDYCWWQFTSVKCFLFVAWLILTVVLQMAH